MKVIRKFIKTKQKIWVSWTVPIFRMILIDPSGFFFPVGWTPTADDALPVRTLNIQNHSEEGYPVGYPKLSISELIFGFVDNFLIFFTNKPNESIQ